MDNFIGEIRIFPLNFPILDWAYCSGSLLALQTNTALFSILGTRFGGDGKQTFGLPDLQGMAVMQAGQGPGLTDRPFAQAGGAQTVTLNSSQMPLHTHTAQATATNGDLNTPEANFLAQGRADIGPTPLRGRPYYVEPTATPAVTMNPMSMGVAGGSQPHNNMQPYLALNFQISLSGMYPVRS